MGRWGGAMGHLPKPAGSSALEEALGFKAPLPSHQARGGHAWGIQHSLRHWGS